MAKGGAKRALAPSKANCSDFHSVFRGKLGYSLGMQNRWGPEGEIAIVRYEDAEFTVLRPGRFVRCAVTDAPIALEDLRYWNVDQQEAYAGPEQALARWRALNGETA